MPIHPSVCEQHKFDSVDLINWQHKLGGYGRDVAGRSYGRGMEIMLMQYLYVKFSKTIINVNKNSAPFFENLL